MAPSDRDRDHRKPHTPPAGVRAQTARPLEEFDAEGLTPVEGDLVSQMKKRGEQAATSSRAAFGAIGDLRRELRESVARDVRDHESMTKSINRIDTQMQTMNEHVGDLRENMGAVRSWVDDERRRRAESDKMQAIVAVEEKKVELEVKKTHALAVINVETTEKLAEIDESTAIAKHRRTRNLKILAAILTAIGGLITAMATQC